MILYVSLVIVKVLLDSMNEFLSIVLEVMSNIGIIRLRVHEIIHDIDSFDRLHRVMLQQVSLRTSRMVSANSSGDMLPSAFKSETSTTPHVKDIVPKHSTHLVRQIYTQTYHRQQLDHFVPND